MSVFFESLVKLSLARHARLVWGALPLRLLQSGQDFLFFYPHFGVFFFGVVLVSEEVEDAVHKQPVRYFAPVIAQCDVPQEPTWFHLPLFHACGARFVGLARRRFSLWE